MPTCPHCHVEIRLRELPYEGLFKNFRVCPGCGKRFTVDDSTKRWQAVFIFTAVVSLALTLLLYYAGVMWLIPATASYIFLGALVYRGNRRIYLVPYREDEKDDDA